MPKHPAFSAELLSVGEAAALAGVHVDTIKRWEKAGRIAALRTPVGHRRFRRADVEKLLTAEAAS
ncbi:excisionase family DNA-binding protein [Mycobacterium sp. TJFP1]